MSKNLSFLIILLTVSFFWSCDNGVKLSSPVKEKPTLDHHSVAPWFEDAKFGVFVHFGIMGHFGYWKRQFDDQPSWLTPEVNEKAASEFNLSEEDVKNWTKLIEGWGAQYAVLTAIQHPGFVFWDSDHNDGWIDFVVADSWYENPGNPQEENFILRKKNMISCHDNIAVDIDGDGIKDIVSLSNHRDNHVLTWYRIPEDFRENWDYTKIGNGIHGGVAPLGYGDLYNDGDVDLVRGNIWFEKRRWERYQMEEPRNTYFPSWQST